ncbi:uracil-DNA glycosylase [Nocardioides mangrovicus]|uniref:Type-4 uracil-DNA glycosylase n=1 Tax=Nocardioides mangrovicus TaxID=2478913 RepID=A0A3L8P544_9ACTN|nr:UdgX family uracil-DNA binding protein [Nocardioides mangrovicus]RLV50345.1 uracil-DNA glycosylase [Nocardioides mangrovicus]
MSDFPGAGAWIPEQPSVESLAAGVRECRGCDLFERATQAVPGRGAARARLMLVGEQPGDQEDQQGKPFVGPAGHLLVDAVEQAGLQRQDLYITNVVKHFRWSELRGKRRIHQNPTRAHVAACGPWLMGELDVVRPEGVVLLGGTAGKAVYGTGFRVGEARGTLASWPAEVAGMRPETHVPDWVLPTAHPSAVLRSQERDRDFELLVADLRVAAQALSDRA